MQHQAQQQQQVARYRAQARNIFDDSDDDDEMALTDVAINAWQAAVERQAEILETGLVFINAQSVKKEIPTFTGEIEGKMAIEEWFKLAERMATHAAWTDEQKLHFFQERMSKSAANFNDSLPNADRVTYAVWKQAILNGLADNTTKARKKEQLKTLKQEEKERVRDFKTRIDDTYRIAYGVNAATSNHADVVALRDETKKDVLLNGLKTQIADLVWNRPEINDATYVETVELAEECEKVVEIKKIAKNKDLSSAVTVMSEEAEKTKEEINNLKGLIQKLMTTPIAQPAVQLEEKTINALNRLAISNTDGKWPSQNRERRTVRFASESPNRSRSQTPENRRRYNTPTPYRGDHEGSNWGDQKQYESRRCYVCDKKGHLARQCWRAKQSPFAQQNARQNGQQTPSTPSDFGDAEIASHSNGGLIIGGLNEVVWPADEGGDPWLSRPMRETDNMPSLERWVGLMAHDFRHNFAGENLFLTRSTRLQGAPTLPSRLLQRLEAALEASGQLNPSIGVSGLIKWKSPLFSLPRVRRLPVRVWTPGRSPGRQGRLPLGWSLSVTEMEFWRREP
ncbi:hypothetical protein DAPPUDRAFT_105537 [Daphnia pulex]|uniref:CCHC-type domain-containing protein n=1 Tax=Daphnia pulex TaxID=6669 RepID=E9GR07_DAPPU|nr:hypothetical protein DAPPUDRAFT_105537 [Daphnia pulex]|eukprot:EFX77928.1 hypothetical protein DAPPUDRAFT_105537 [Daphnia pulex]